MTSSTPDLEKRLEGVPKRLVDVVNRLKGIVHPDKIDPPSQPEPSAKPLADGRFLRPVDGNAAHSAIPEFDELAGTLGGQPFIVPMHQRAIFFVTMGPRINRSPLMSIRTAEELEKLKAIGKIVRMSLDKLASAVRSGITTGELDGSRRVVTRQMDRADR
jgi:hypothetical protein